MRSIRTNERLPVVYCFALPKWLRSVRFHDGTQEKTLVRIEKEVFIGFYSIRKLFDTLKVSLRTKNLTYEITSYPNTKTVDYFNRDEIDETFNLSFPLKEIKDVTFICNQFVHSYVFQIDGDDRIEGFYISSDRLRKKRLLYIPIDVVLSIFRTVGRDYAEGNGWRRDSTGQWVQYETKRP